MPQVVVDEAYEDTPEYARKELTQAVARCSCVTLVAIGILAALPASAYRSTWSVPPSNQPQVVVDDGGCVTPIDWPCGLIYNLRATYGLL